MILFLGLNLLFLRLFYKEIIITSLDPEYATILGINSTLITWILLSLVSLTIVGSFTAVGVVMVLAIMITPPATAYLVTKSIQRMIILSLVIAILYATIGFFLAWELDLSIAGMIAAIGGLAFLFTMIIRYFIRSHSR
jgi:manganese/zinc/iron transport system permease protein